ncbi:ATP-dependent Clp protease proteolytic subunit [Janibacter alkaliphilus]|uniref:ATP-dependent Clp protease proteolytic subunit n=1 Tax=Janibacter alkaliphilus TaxID=1069963 RepID=A0A852XFM2_9MICO|nr:ATP-dependent Clp protease proteolytic subunit [Janibacter alkaliphilus]NYG37335.1 ATP-dependent Clp protease protease subunit [Janibacter alkaliphilus]
MSGSYLIPNVVARDSRGERVLDLFTHLLGERIVYVGTPVDEGVANAIIGQLLHLEATDPDRPIDLYLNSPGGAMNATLAVYDTMQLLRAPVATTCVGEASGSAVALLAGGARGRRTILPHSRVMLQQPKGGSRGAIPDLVVEADEILRLRREMEQVLARHTGRTPEQVRADSDRDHVLDAPAALAYGLVDEIVEPRGDEGPGGPGD